MNLDPLTTPELYGDLCNIVERNQEMPRPGRDGDYGLRHTSNEARAAANDILDAVFRAFGQERPKVDPFEYVRGTHPGHTDAWYEALLRRMEAYRRGEELPELPDE